jgi:hypothetical protein
MCTFAHSLSIGDDSITQIWDIRYSHAVAKIEGHSQRVNSVRNSVNKIKIYVVYVKSSGSVCRSFGVTCMPKSYALRPLTRPSRCGLSHRAVSQSETPTTVSQV